MAGTRGRSGGARPGAGRKPKREQYQKEINAAEKTLAAAQEEAARMLLQLMRGGVQRVSERREPAGLILIEQWIDAVDKQGNPTGKKQRVKVKAFPELPPEQLVLVDQKIDELEPDRAATVEIMNRIQDKPATQPPTPQQLAAAVKALIGVDIDRI